MKAFLASLIKKIIIDCEIFKNYRPVSNLYFISKLLERIVGVQLVEHLKTNNLYDIFQTAYRQLHSTETHSFVYKMTYSKPLTMREEQFSAAWFKTCIWYHRPSEINEFIKPVFLE